MLHAPSLQAAEVSSCPAHNSVFAQQGERRGMFFIALFGPKTIR